MEAVTALPPPYATLRIYANNGPTYKPVVYESASQQYEVYYKTGAEFGDEIDLTLTQHNATANSLDEFSFEAYGDAVEAVTAVDAVAATYEADGTTIKTPAVAAVAAVAQGTATLRIYANDGDAYGSLDTGKTGGEGYGANAVSYTHLTLPTICSV